MAAPSSRKLAVKSVLRFFFRHLIAYRWTLTFVITATVVVELLMTTILPYVTKLMFDRLATVGASPVAFDQLKPLILLFIGLGLVAWFLRNRLFLIRERTSAFIMADIEQTSLSYLLGHSYQFFENEFGGSLVRRISRIARAFEEAFDGMQQRFLPMVVAFTGILVVLFQRSSLIASMVFVWLLLMIVYNFLYSRWKVKGDIERAAQDSVCTGLLSDTISNVVTVKLFSASIRESTVYKKASDHLRDLRAKAWQTHSMNYSLQALVLLLLQGSVLWISLRFWSLGRMSAGDIVLFQGYFATLYMRVLDFSRLIRSLHSAFADASEMVEIIELPHGIQDEKHAKRLSVKRGAVSFDHVQFSYGANAVLNDFHLKIEPNEKIAFVGSSGAGKSTLVKLLFRFYDITQGVISIDGQDIRRVTQDSLRAAIALVPQEPVLFHRSLLENIRYGKPNATKQEIMQAAKLAHCHEFIEKMPNKYETLVGERGVKLSGGERQRVAIARAILKDAPILVLDEATSSLDSESEGLIQDALCTLMKNKTTIVIAHRLSTIMSMDRIVIMDKGRVADTGTHAELVQQAGIYQKLWNLQVGGFFQE